MINLWFFENLAPESQAAEERRNSLRSTNKVPQSTQEAKKIGTKKKPRISEWKKTEEYKTTIIQKDITSVVSDGTGSLENKNHMIYSGCSIPKKY